MMLDDACFLLWLNLSQLRLQAIFDVKCGMSLVVLECMIQDTPTCFKYLSGVSGHHMQTAFETNYSYFYLSIPWTMLQC